MKKQEATIQEVIEVEQHATKTKKQTGDEKLKYFIEQEGFRTVKGKFRNYETPGGGVRIQIRKYPERLGVKPFDKYMIDEGVYEIPLYVARHLNGLDVTATHESVQGKIHSCSYGVSGFKTDRYGTNLTLGVETINEAGVPTVLPNVQVVKRVRRFGFESLEFAQ